MLRPKVSAVIHPAVAPNMIAMTDPLLSRDAGLQNSHTNRKLVTTNSTAQIASGGDPNPHPIPYSSFTLPRAVGTATNTNLEAEATAVASAILWRLRI